MNLFEILKKMINLAKQNGCRCVRMFNVDDIDSEILIEFECKEKNHKWQIKYNYLIDIICCKECQNEKNNKIITVKKNIGRNKEIIKKAVENKYIVINLNSDSVIRDNMNIVCNNNHSSELLLGGLIIHNYNCHKCKRLYMLNEAKQLAINKGGKCLSNDYINSKDHLKWKCCYGHTWETSFSGVKHKFTWCPHCNIGVSEAICREIFQILFDIEFIKVRPIWLNKFELDGYAELKDGTKLAFEYDGIQHFSFIEQWHETIEYFEKMQLRDKEKDLLCKENNVILIRIPYTIKKKRFSKIYNRKMSRKQY